MKNLLFGLIATVLFVNLGKAQNIEDLKSSKNPYKDKGEQLFQSLHKLADDLESKKITKESLESYLINNNLKKTHKLNDKDLILVQNYFKSNQLSVANSIKLEQQLINDNKNDELLHYITDLTWSLYFVETFSSNTELRGSGPTRFERCIDRCMVKELNSMNPVEVAFMVAGIPASVAQMVASCAWDCW